jgi:PPOX class probable F420-dependent enzyme
MNGAAQTLKPFVKQWAVLLTTYKRDGTPVGTAVNIVVERDHAYFRTWDTAWKLRRIRNNPEVEVAPSTALGMPTAPAIEARARVLEGEESAHAGTLLARKYPVSHGLLVPLLHRLRGNKTMHIELTPAGAPSQNGDGKRD